MALLYYCAENCEIQRVGRNLLLFLLVQCNEKCMQPKISTVRNAQYFISKILKGMGICSMHWTFKHPGGRLATAWADQVYQCCKHMHLGKLSKSCLLNSKSAQCYYVCCYKHYHLGKPTPKFNIASLVRYTTTIGHSSRWLNPLATCTAQKVLILSPQHG